MQRSSPPAAPKHLAIIQALPRFETWGVRLRYLGFADRLPPGVLRCLRQAEKRTRGNRRSALNVVLDYGGRD